MLYVNYITIKWEEKKKMWFYTHAHTHTGILFSYKKEGNPAICDNTDEPGGHYTKWSKPEMERQTLYDLNCMWNLKKLNS